MLSRSTLLLTILCALLSIYTAVATDADGLAFLEAKGKEEGVVTLPSGLMYKELRAGNGAFVEFYRAFMLAGFVGVCPSAV